MIIRVTRLIFDNDDVNVTSTSMFLNLKHRHFFYITWSNLAPFWVEFGGILKTNIALIRPLPLLAFRLYRTFIGILRAETLKRICMCHDWSRKFYHDNLKWVRRLKDTVWTSSWAFHSTDGYRHLNQVHSQTKYWRD